MGDPGVVTALRRLGFGVLLAHLACAGPREASGPKLPQGPVGLRYRTLDGEVRTLGALRGQVVILHILTTWSDPALFEVPRLAELARSRPDDVEVIALVLDPEPLTAAIFADTFDIPYSVGRVPRMEWFTSESGPFGPITVIPTSIVIDPTGRVAARSDGTWPPGVLERIVGRLASP